MDVKVCHFTTAHNIDDVRIFAKQCTSLAANGFDVTLIAFGDDEFEDVKNGVKRISLNVPVKNRIERFIKRSKVVYNKLLEVNADIYQLHDPELLPVGLKLKKRGKKVIFDSHEFYELQIRHKEYIPKLLRNFISILYKKYETYVCKRIDAVIQICTLNGKDYFRGRAKKTVFIRNVSLFKESKNCNISSYSNRNSVVLMGTLSYDRGITHIIKACAKVQVPLILAGNFVTEDYKKEVESMEEYSIVDYRGYVNYSELNVLFDKCFAGLSTGLKLGQSPLLDTMPTKAYDFMAAGLPFIISNTKFKVETIEEYDMGLTVEPDNVTEIAEAIKFLRDNKDIAKQKGENGRRAFENEFNWLIEEKKLIELYNSL